MRRRGWWLVVAALVAVGLGAGCEDKAAEGVLGVESRRQKEMELQQEMARKALELRRQEVELLEKEEARRRLEAEMKRQAALEARLEADLEAAATEAERQALVKQLEEARARLREERDRLMEAGKRRKKTRDGKAIEVECDPDDPLCEVTGHRVDMRPERRP